MDITRTYRGRFTYLLPLLVIPLFFTVGTFLDKDYSDQFILFNVFFWLLFLIPVVCSLGFKLEIGKNFIKNYFFGFLIKHLQQEAIQSINYGGVGMWGSVLPGRGSIHGKGLAILYNAGGTYKTYGLSEKLYGTEAIEMAKKTLQAQVVLSKIIRN